MNVMLFKCVTQLSGFLVGRGYLNQNMFYTVPMLQCVLFIQMFFFEMHKSIELL